MIAFQQPCSGFTAADLINLQAIWPDGTHRVEADCDRFIVCQSREEPPWLSIARQRDGTYLSVDQSGRVYARGPTLAALGLDGCGDSHPRSTGRPIE
jgi:hypothetical protein